MGGGLKITRRRIQIRSERMAGNAREMLDLQNTLCRATPPLRNRLRRDAEEGGETLSRLGLLESVLESRITFGHAASSAC